MSALDVARLMKMYNGYSDVNLETIAAQCRSTLLLSDNDHEREKMSDCLKAVSKVMRARGMIYKVVAGTDKEVVKEAEATKCIIDRARRSGIWADDKEPA